MIQCADEKEFRTGEIREANTAFKRATNHHAACQNSWDKAKVDLEINVQDQADAQAALKETIRIREQEHELFLTRVEDHKRAVIAIEGAIEIVDELTAGEATLVQLSAHSSNLLKTGITIHMSGSYAPVVAMLAQMATSEDDLFVDEGAVGRIREMLSNLIENIHESLDGYSLEEELAVENFNILKTNLENTIRELKAMEERLIDHIGEMEQCVLEEEVIITKSSAKLERNTNLLNASIEMCAAFDAEYHTATDSRTEELELLVVVRQMVDRRLGNVGSSITERDDGFAEYEGFEHEAAEFDHDGGDAEHRIEEVESY